MDNALFTSDNHAETQQRLYQLLLEQLGDKPKIQQAVQLLVGSGQDGDHGIFGENAEGDLFAAKHGKTTGDRVRESLGALGLSNDEKFELANAMTLLEYLSRGAPMAAASFQILSEPNLHPVHQLIKKSKKNNIPPSKIIAALKRVSMENVFTAHPTYIGDLQYTKDLRALDLAISKTNHAYAADDLQTAKEAEQTVTEAIKDLVHRPSIASTAIDADGETEYMRHYLKNTYRSIPYIYATFDEAFGTEGYNPLDLKLDLSFKSWGSSGDKDGNKNVTSQSLERAISRHRDTIIDVYNEELNKIEAALGDDQSFASDIQAIRDALADFYRPDATDTLKIKTRGEDFGKQAGELRARLSAFSQTLYTTTKDTNKQVANRALGLHRNLHTFGLSIGEIEFRETADENQFVLDHIISKEIIGQAVPGSEAARYSDLQPDDRTTVLNYILDNQIDLTPAIEEALDQVPKEAKAEGYGYADSGEGKANNAIFYQTIERLRLAAANSDMFKGQVLAEAESPVQMKEMLLLLKATGCDQHIRITPLFEDPEVLADLENIMDDLHTDPHLFCHYVTVSLHEWEEKAARGLRTPIPASLKQEILDWANDTNIDIGSDTFHADVAVLNEKLIKHQLLLPEILGSQVQLAHSDNSRRGGMAGARAGIFKAHNVIRESAANVGLSAQMYEGGSHTDSFRMGVRSYRGLVNTYDNHRFMKATVQGMDLAQLFSSPVTIEAFITENICNAADKLQEKSRGLNRLGDKAKGYHDRAIMNTDTLTNTVISEVDRYQNRYFGSKEEPNVVLGNVMAQVFSYQNNKQSGTIGTRGGARGKGKDQSLYLNPVTDTRTIGYSETLQQGRMNPNFIGAGRLRSKLEELIESAKTNHSHGASVTAHRELLDGHIASPDAEGKELNTLYMESPMVRDAIDRVAYAVATTDFGTVWDNAIHDYSSGKQEQRTIIHGEVTQEDIDSGALTDGRAWEETITKAPTQDELEGLAEKYRNTPKDQSSAKEFLAWMEGEYREAAKVVMEAICPECNRTQLEHMSTRELAVAVRRALPMYTSMMNRQDVLMEVADFIEHDTPKEARSAKYDGVENGINRAVHNLRDTTTLQRPPFRIEQANQKLLEPEQDKSAGMIQSA